MSEPTTAEHSGDQAACLAARLVAAKTKLSAAENELEASECGHDQAAVAKQELVVAKAKLRVADAELELAKHRLEIAEADGDPAAVAESKVGVAKQEVGVAEAKVGVAKQEVGVARAEEKPAAITILGGANCGLRLAQIAYEQALQACSVGAATTHPGAKAGAGGDAASNPEAGAGTVLEGSGSRHSFAAFASVDHGIQPLIVILEEQRKRDEAFLEEQRKRDEASLEEQRQQFGSLVLALRQVSGQASSSPTPSTVGKQAYEFLDRAGRWTRISEIGPSVITADQSHEVKSAIVDQTLQNKETKLIHWFTPHLLRLVELAGQRVGTKMLLVNSERHPWVLDPHLGAASKPDLWCAHPGFWKEKKSEGDNYHDGQGFRFGVLAEWVCRDCVECVWEWKVQMGNDDFSALGEGIEYCKRLSHVNGSSPSTLNEARARDTRVVACDWKQFYLVRCRDGVPIECKVGSWAGPGSQEAVVNFLAANVDRQWTSSIDRLCTKFGVVLDASHPCFLGCGAIGRVFKVTTSSGTEAALKVAVGSRGCDALVAEAKAYECTDQTGETTTRLLQHYCDRGGTGFAGLLVTPVGQKLPRTREAITSALQGLKRLSESGFKHGDARSDNVFWDAGRERAVWTDLRTLSLVEHVDRENAFQEDVVYFARSMDIELPASGLREALPPFLNAGRGSETEAAAWEHFRELFTSIWTRRAATEVLVS